MLLVMRRACLFRLIAVTLATILLSTAAANAQDEGFAASNGVEIYYHTYGSGAPLLVLNGGPGISSRHFEGIGRDLAALGRRTILFDQRGTGRSQLKAAQSSTVNVRLMIEDIEAVRRHLGIETWTVFGHSWGGMYAMLYAAQHPERVDGLILSSSGGMTLDWLQYAGDNILMRLGPERRAKYEYWLDPANAGSNPAHANRKRVEAMAAAYVFDPENIPFVVEALTAPNANFPRVRGLVYADLSRINYDMRAPLAEFAKPVLILHGRQDLLGDLVPYQTHQTLPNSQLVWIDRCSHYPWLDNPEVYFESISSFLTSLSTQHTRSD